MKQMIQFPVSEIRKAIGEVEERLEVSIMQKHKWKRLKLRFIHLR